MMRNVSGICNKIGRRVEEKLRYIVFLAVLFTFCSTSAQDITALLTEMSESWSTLDVARLNSEIEKWVSDGRSWTNSPLMLNLHLFGDDLDAKILAFLKEKNRTEGVDTTRIVYVSDSLLDDSVRGKWHEVLYVKLSDGTWRVVGGRVAYRCWRLEDQERFQRELCP